MATVTRHLSKAILFNAIPSVVDTVLSLRAHKATKFIAPNLIVRAVAPLQRGKIPGYSKTLVLSVGTPNFLERKFIKLCLKSKEPFPVKMVQVKYAPVPRIKNKKKRK